MGLESLRFTQTAIVCKEMNYILMSLAANLNLTAECLENWPSQRLKLNLYF